MVTTGKNHPAHDFAISNLTAISTALEVLAKENRTPDEIRGAFTSAHNACNNLINLVHDLIADLQDPDVGEALAKIRASLEDAHKS